jgi:thymidylate synthase (FAD)
LVLKHSKKERAMENSQVIKQEWEALERPSVAAIDAILGHQFPVLDHGFVRVIDYMGNDAAIVQAARVSYGAGTKTVNEDAGLINYLMEHRHSTPFEMCEIKLHVKLPIFVARQWIRHRTANVNEYSARYSIMDKEFYIPRSQNVQAQSQSNKQGREGGLEHNEVENFINGVETVSNNCYDFYEDAIGGGVARELARMSLPVNYYTQWYWKIDLHNLLHFLHLRADSHAQYEIRAYAETMLRMVKLWVPLTYAAFEKNVIDAVTLNRDEMKVIARVVNGETVTSENSGLSDRSFKKILDAIAKFRGM